MVIAFLKTKGTYAWERSSNGRWKLPKRRRKVAEVPLIRIYFGSRIWIKLIHHHAVACQGQQVLTAFSNHGRDAEIGRQVISRIDTQDYTYKWHGNYVVTQQPAQAPLLP